MDEQRGQDYLNLIHELLNCANGQELEIVQANQNLIDEGLVTVMELVADDMAKSGNKNAEWLRNFAAQLAEPIGESSWNQLYQRVVELYGQGKYDQAVIVAEQALDLAQQLWGEEHPHVATSLNNLALLYKSDRPDEALELMRQATEVEDKIIRREFAASCERDRLNHLQTIRGSFEGLLCLVFNYFPKSPKAVQTALDLVLRRKSLTAAAALAAQNQALYSGRYPHLSSSSSDRALSATKSSTSPMLSPHQNN